MQRILLACAICAIATLTAHAQLPGIAAQNSVSYVPATANNDVASDRGLVSFYAVGTPFSILQTGAVTQTGPVDGQGGKEYDAPDGLSTASIRVVYTYDNWVHHRYAGYITYMSPTQINFVALGTACGLGELNSFPPQYCGTLAVGGTFAFRVEKRACSTCPYFPISQSENINFVRVAPHSAVYYNENGGPWIIADLYCSAEGFLLKSTFSGPNPRFSSGGTAGHPAHAPAATVLAIYGSGAQTFYPSTVCFYDIKYDGATPADYFIGYFNTPFFGVFQFNSNVPANLTSQTPIQLGAGYRVFEAPCNLGYNYGNIAYLENVQ